MSNDEHKWSRFSQRASSSTDSFIEECPVGLVSGVAQAATSTHSSSSAQWLQISTATSAVILRPTNEIIQGERKHIDIIRTTHEKISKQASREASKQASKQSSKHASSCSNQVGTSNSLTLDRTIGQGEGL